MSRRPEGVSSLAAQPAQGTVEGFAPSAPVGPGGSIVEHVSEVVSVIDAEGILTYGQSSNPASSHFNDQTRKYAAGEWVKLPFTDAQIKADPNFKQVQITE